MKKFFVMAAALLLLGFQANAQLIGGAGYIYSSEKTSGVDGTTPFHGFYAGASYKLDLGKGFGVAPGLYASFLLHNENANDGGAKANYNVDGNDREFALNVPVKLTYTLDLGNDRAVFAYAGPVFQLGLTNTTTVTGSVSVLGLNLSGGSKVDNYEKDYMNRFNIYLGGGIGFQLGDLLFHLGYDHSLLDIDKSTNYVTSRGQFKLGVGIEF